MRPFLFALLSACLLAACRTEEYVPYRPPPSEQVVVGLDATGCELVFLLPDGWRRAAAEPSFKGFRYRHGPGTIEVQIRLKEEAFASLVEQARADTSSVVRTVEPHSPWPFVGVVVTYRGPPDEPMLEAFIRSFRVERR